MGTFSHLNWSHRTLGTPIFIGFSCFLDHLPDILVSKFIFDGKIIIQWVHHIRAITSDREMRPWLNCFISMTISVASRCGLQPNRLEAKSEKGPRNNFRGDGM